jgi:UDP-N-acetylglucosamine:LPS N-acetylglucosamine transferase
MKKISFVFLNAGGGHRSAADALRLVIQQQQRPWKISLISLQDVLEELDFIKKRFNIRGEDVYNLLLKRGWTLGLEPLMRVMHAVIRFRHKDQVRVLERYWRAAQPDLVVSLIPHFNRALLESLKQACPDVPFVTILTDFSDFPPNGWIVAQDQYVVCGTARAAGQARAIGLPKHRILRSSGMILHPRFYEPADVDREAARAELKLKPHLPTALVLFGGQGSQSMPRIAQSLSATKRKIQAIFLCGRNEDVFQSLASRPLPYPHVAVGFTPDVPYYMRLADFLIGKPGPGSISEAMAMGLPAIVEKNAWTMPQERYNADWLEEKGAGIVVRDFRQIAAAVDQLLDPEAYARYKQNASSIQNRAVFEIPDMLERILEQTGPSGA